MRKLKRKTRQNNNFLGYLWAKNIYIEELKYFAFHERETAKFTRKVYKMLKLKFCFILSFYKNAN